MNIEVNDIALKGNTLLHNIYNVKEVYYVGEQGIVYLGEDTQTGMELIIKEFMPYRSANRDLDGKNVICKSNGKRKMFESARKSFLQECECTKLLKNVDKPYNGCILQYIDSFEENKTMYLVVEKVEGCNLDECMEDLEEEDKWNIIKSLTEIIRQMHKRGVIHCDIKPSNILLRSDGKIALIDFGNACVTSKEPNSMMFASRGYAPPELYFGKKVDEQTDIYSLGAVIYHMLTGYQLPQSTDYEDIEDITKISQFIKISGIKEYFIMKTLNRNKKKRLKSLFLLQIIL